MAAPSRPARNYGDLPELPIPDSHPVAAGDAAVRRKDGTTMPDTTPPRLCSDPRRTACGVAAVCRAAGAEYADTILLWVVATHGATCVGSPPAFGD